MYQSTQIRVSQRKQPLARMIVAAVVLFAGAAATRAADVVAVFKLNGPLTEQPSENPLAVLMGEEAPMNMFALLERLKEARQDPTLKAVVFDIDNAALGLAQIEELRAQIQSLKAADKDVWVLAEGLNNGTMMLGSEASRLMLVPSGEVMIHGLYAQGMYFKGLLDKIGIEADILHCGDFKSAGEPFYRTGPSPEAEAQTNRLYDSIFGQMIERIADSRGLTDDQVHGLIDRAVFSAKQAVEEKLVDKLMYREDFVDAIKARYGDDVKVTSKYAGKKDELDIDFNNPFAIFKMFGEMMKLPAESTNPAIAIVYVEGPITTGPTKQGMFGGGNENAGSDTIRRAIAEAAADSSVKALVLRVDSPGGSALASDIIAEATNRFKASGRPFIVSMGNVAASGGYYVSTGADAIYAEPMTITGSIGVVGGKFITKGFWDWVGISTHEYQRGKLADIMSTNHKWEGDERQVIVDLMNRVYGEFKDRVVEGRKGKLTDDIEKLAGGRVYTGAEAIKIGLVDRLGGFTDAIKRAADDAEISDYELRVFPRPKSPFDLLAEILGGQDKPEKFVAANLTSLPTVAGAVEAIRAVDPQKAAITVDFLRHVEMLQRDGVLLVSPTATIVME
ncbi:MAG: signal peptide peptidase SppA [Phycisphaerales bacterium]|nr:signal peptide peptidase SppA [Phycisphaerales bacterium]